jgi:hypothetical protein
VIWRELVRPDEARDGGLGLDQIDVLDLGGEELDDAAPIDAPVAALDVEIEERIEVHRALVEDAVFLHPRIAHDGGLIEADDLALIDPQGSIAGVERAEPALADARAGEDLRAGRRAHDGALLVQGEIAIQALDRGGEQRLGGELAHVAHVEEVVGVERAARLAGHEDARRVLR